MASSDLGQLSGIHATGGNLRQRVCSIVTQRRRKSLCALSGRCAFKRKNDYTEFFRHVPDLAYTSDSFTPASFVSHASNIKREELAKVDLLPRIRYRVMIVRDLAPIFGAKDDELLKTLGILTRALDGEGLRVDSGDHGSRGYQGDYLFMLLAGTTPIMPRVFKVMGHAGQSFVLPSSFIHEREVTRYWFPRTAGIRGRRRNAFAEELLIHFCGRCGRQIQTALNGTKRVIPMIAFSS